MDALSLVKQYLPNPSRNTLHFLASALTDEIERIADPSRKAKLTERRDSLLRAVAGQSATESEKTPGWLKDALSQLEASAKIAERSADTEREIEAEVKTMESKTDISTRPDFSQKAGNFDETATAEPKDFAAQQKAIWADIMKTAGSADTSQEASPDDWRSEFSGMVDMSKYTAKLHAEKATKRQAELDHMAAVRREHGIPDPSQ